MVTTRTLAAVSCGLLVLGAAPIDSATPLKLDVTPAVSRAPAVLTVRVMVTPAPDNRALQVVAESAGYYRSSAVELDGANGEAVNLFEFRDLPAGMYQITGTVVDGHGRQASTFRLAKVEPALAR